ncbi:hypothetical protein [Helicobacter sp. 23-1045]
MKNTKNSQNLAQNSPYSQNLRNFTHPLAPSAREGEFSKFISQNLAHDLPKTQNLAQDSQNLYKSPPQSQRTQHYKRQIIIALSVIVFTIVLFLRVGFAYQKSGFHIDESASIAISTGSGILQFENGEYFAKELKERMYFDDNSINDLWHDLKELWKNNYGDGAAHPNLYYTLLRAWSFDVKSGDFGWLKARGIGLNLVFFTLGFCASFILMTKIFSRTNFFVPLFLAFAFLNSASVSNTIFIRPYALQEMLLMVFVLNCFVFYNLDSANLV